MGVSSRESTKAKGVKGVDRLSVGTFYFYSTALGQHEKNQDKAVSDKDAEAVAEMLVADAEAGVSDKTVTADVEQKLNSILSAGKRFKSPYGGDYLTVTKKDGDIWILA